MTGMYPQITGDLTELCDCGYLGEQDLLLVGNSITLYWNLKSTNLQLKTVAGSRPVVEISFKTTLKKV